MSVYGERRPSSRLRRWTRIIQEVISFKIVNPSNMIISDGNDSRDGDSDNMIIKGVIIRVYFMFGF